MYTLDQKSSVGPKASFLVAINLPDQPFDEVEEHLAELAELVRSCGGKVVGREIQRRRRPDPATFIGKGKAQEIASLAKEAGAEIIVFDDDLSPSQVKNLEKLVQLPVMDRSSVILEIFSRRARSREARTQVELARLGYLLPRLTRLWGHLSRQVGGIGVRGGAGETQLEADRRMLRQRIKKLKKDLKKIERTRQVQRRGRQQMPVIALAGYTNAGKSTLFNRLTGAGVKAENLLFATLDSRLRRGALKARQIVLFGDTVGFIRKLPHHLVSSFRSTLEEITEADVVLHVVDRSHPAWPDQLKVANRVLEDLEVDPAQVVLVFNKTDQVDPLSSPDSHSLAVESVSVSALTGDGLDDLKALLSRRFFPGDGTIVDTPEVSG